MRMPSLALTAVALEALRRLCRHQFLAQPEHGRAEVAALGKRHLRALLGALPDKRWSGSTLELGPYHGDRMVAAQCRQLRLKLKPPPPDPSGRHQDLAIALSQVRLILI